jgi:hypothetical protein
MVIHVSQKQRRSFPCLFLRNEKKLFGSSRRRKENQDLVRFEIYHRIFIFFSNTKANLIGTGAYCANVVRVTPLT